MKKQKFFSSKIIYDSSRTPSSPNVVRNFLDQTSRFLLSCRFHILLHEQNSLLLKSCYKFNRSLSPSKWQSHKLSMDETSTARILETKRGTNLIPAAFMEREGISRADACPGKIRDSRYPANFFCGLSISVRAGTMGEGQARSLRYSLKLNNNILQNSYSRYPMTLVCECMCARTSRKRRDEREEVKQEGVCVALCSRGYLFPLEL